jgi:hypothetical protein
VFDVETALLEFLLRTFTAVFLDDATVEQVDRAIGMTGVARVVCDHADGRPLAMQLARCAIPTFSRATITRSLRSADFMPRYVNGSSTFSYTVKSPMRLKLWKMNPISRLRTRARSESGRSATDLPLRMYFPSVGESRRPRIDSNVDFPQPDGPAIAMYSPLLISR